MNNEVHNFVSSVMRDGNTLLLGNAYNEDGSLSAGASLTHKTPAGWSFPEKINILNHYNRSCQYVTFFMSNSGKILIMTVKRDDSFGGEDIYVSFLQNNGNWSEPMNLGEIINTPGD